MRSSKEYIKFIVSMLIFGTNGLLVTNISLSSAEIVLTRTFLGSLFLLPIVLIKKDFSLQKFKGTAITVILAGLSLGAGWVFLFEAYKYASVSIGTLTYYCGPIIVMILSPLVFREQLAANKIIAIGAVAFGMLCITGISSVTGEIARGIIFGAIAAFFYAALIISNKFVKGFTGIDSTLAQLTVAFLVILLYLLLTQGTLFNIPQGRELIFIIILGIVNTGLACYLYFSSMQQLPGQTVALCCYLDPLSALIVSVLFLNERLTAIQIIGAIFILGGALLGELKLRNKRSDSTLT
jgi:drug/metabolite transporter (DMT)-like permease